MKRCKILKHLSIRFILHGHIHKPIYSIVVINRIAHDKGKYVEKLGYFDPSFTERRLQIDSGRLAY
jgi:ribosomal protein S16